MVLIKGKLYDSLKYIALVALPAIGTLYVGLNAVWGLPSTPEVVRTILVVDTFLGTLLHLSSKAYNKSDSAYDGNVVIDENQLGKKSISLELFEEADQMPKKIDNRGELRFKVKNAQEVQQKVRQRKGSRRKHGV